MKFEKGDERAKGDFVCIVYAMRSGGGNMVAWQREGRRTKDGGKKQEDGGK